MNSELFDQALGSDEPPVTIDFEAVEASGARALRRRSALLVSGVAAAVVLAIGGAVFATQPSAPRDAAAHGIRYAAPTDRQRAYCYRTADISSDATNQHVMFGVSGPADTAAEAMDICSDAWKTDLYGWIPAGQPRAAPPLIGCVLSSDALNAATGTVGIFPGTPQTCADLSLAVAKA
jgi:hypothetical protein